MKLALPTLFGALCLAQTAYAQDVYSTYHNARFGTFVRYPSNLVEPQPESSNGDGRKFVSRDGKIELTVYGFNNASGRSASGEMRRAINDWEHDGARLTYYKASRNWFTLSGYLGADIFYEKTLLQRGVFHTLIWQYPKTLKKRLDASVSRSAASFSAGGSIARPKTSAPRLQFRPDATPLPTSRPVAHPMPRVYKARPRFAPRVTSGY